MTLYDINDTFAELVNNDDLTDEQFAEQFDNLHMALEDKVSNGIGLIQNLKATADAMKAEEIRLKNRRSAIENRIERIKQLYQYTLAAMNLKKVSTPRGAMSIAKVGGKKSLKIADENLIPQDFWKMIYEVDKEKIRTALESGAEVQGAYLEERGTYLKIS